MNANLASLARRLRTVPLPVWFGGLAALLVLVRILPYGAGWTPDSASYLSTAENLARGWGFNGFSGEPFTDQGALYPLILMPFALIGINLAAAATLINVALFGCITALCTAWLERNVRPGWLILAGTLLCAASPSMLEVSSFLLSEPLYVLLALLAIFAFADGQVRRAALLTALAVQARYSGIILALLLITVLLANSGLAWPRRRRYALLFGANVFLPLSLWVVHNLTAVGWAFGPRYPSNMPLGESLRWSVHWTLAWFIPESLLVAMPEVARLVLLAGLFASVVWLTRRMAAARLLAWFALAHVALVVIMPAFSAMEGPNPRLLAPAYLSFVLAACAAGGSLLERARTGIRPVLRAVLAGLVALWGTGAVFTSGIQSLDHMQYGAGLTGATWRESRILALLFEFPPEGAVVSNRPDILYRYFGWQMGHTPRKTPFNAPSVALNEMRVFQMLVDSSPGVKVIWLEAGFIPHFYSLAELDVMVGLTPILMTGDGGLYEVKARPAGP